MKNIIKLWPWIWLIFLWGLFQTASAQTSIPTNGVTSISGTDTYTATYSGQDQLRNGFAFKAQFTNGNTGASTLNITLNGVATGAIALRKSDGTALSSGDIDATDWGWVVYFQSPNQFRLQPGFGSGGGGTWGTITGTLSDQTDLQTALNLKANLASPTFTGTPAAPTATALTNTTQLATTAFAQRNVIGKVFYVDDYGAVGDSNGTTGNGTDNSTALANCMAAAVANGGGVIQFGEGIYRTTTNFSTSGSSNIVIKGLGKGISGLFFDHLINAANLSLVGSNVGLYDMTISGRKTFTGSAHLVYVVNATNAYVMRNEVKEANCFGIMVLNSTNVYVQCNDVHDSAADGIHASIGVTKFDISNNFIADVADDGIGIGYEGTISNGVISNNTLTNIGGAGINFWGYDTGDHVSKVFDISATGNKITSTWGPGIGFHTSQGSLSAITVTGNHIFGAGTFTPPSGMNCRAVTQAAGVLFDLFGGASKQMQNIKVTDNHLYGVRNNFIAIGTAANLGSQSAICRDIVISDNKGYGNLNSGGAGAAAGTGGGNSVTPSPANYAGIAVANIQNFPTAPIIIKDNQFTRTNAEYIKLETTALGSFKITGNAGSDGNVATGTAYAYSILPSSSTTMTEFYNNSATSPSTAYSTGINNLVQGSVHNRAVIVSGLAIGKNASLGNTTPAAELEILQRSEASAWIPAIKVTPGSGNSMTANTPFPTTSFEASTQTWAAGSSWGLTPQVFHHWKPPTMAFASASTVGYVYNGYFEQPVAGTNATLTNPFALGYSGRLHGVFVGSATSTPLTQAIFHSRSTGTMADGFGTDLQFAIEDTDAVKNTIGLFRFVRDGADNSGKMQMYVYGTGTPVVRLNIRATGKVRVGDDTSATAEFEIAGNATNQARERLFEDTDNGTNYVELQPAASLASDVTLTYPIVTGTIPSTLSGSATLDFPDTAAGTVSDLTVTVTGAADGDVAMVGAVNASVPAAGTFYAWVSATNTVTVRFANNALVAAHNPASGTFKVTVIK